MKNILCFGDSNTYGYKPDGTGRYDENTRWTRLLQQRLGEDRAQAKEYLASSGKPSTSGEQFNIIEEGLCGRTTHYQDANRPGRCGTEQLCILLETHHPLDLVIIMLGTNDCKTRYHATAQEIGSGIRQLVEEVRRYADQKTRVLVISPIHLADGVGDAGYDSEFDEQSVRLSHQIAEELEKVARREQVLFLDAAQYAQPSETDREHMDETGHARLAEAIAQKLHNIIDS